MLKPKLKFNVWFPGWITGMTIYPFIMFKRSKAETPIVNFRHEMQHIYQVRKKGWVPFYVSYLYYNLRYGYANNPYEKEAYAIQNTPLTPEEQAIWDAA